MRQRGYTAHAALMRKLAEMGMTTTQFEAYKQWGMATRKQERANEAAETRRRERDAELARRGYGSQEASLV